MAECVAFMRLHMSTLIAHTSDMKTMWSICRWAHKIWVNLKININNTETSHWTQF